MFFSAENLSDKTVVGHAAFNVPPSATRIHFAELANLDEAIVGGREVLSTHFRRNHV